MFRTSIRTFIQSIIFLWHLYRLISFIYLHFLQVLDLMKEVNEDALEPNIAGSENNLNSDGGGSSDNSGYHSDSDSTVMMSGNSPFISKSARYNFLSRSGKSILNFILFLNSVLLRQLIQLVRELQIGNLEVFLRCVSTLKSIKIRQ